MPDVRDLRVHALLRGGARVTIRAVRPDDRQRIAAAFRNLDRESVYTRFFSYKRELSAGELARIESIDFVHDVMLVATVPRGDDEVVVGSARYVATEAGAGPREAEVAFTVEEDFQGQGLAGRLLEELVRAARQNGIARLVAEVLPENKSMRRVFARAGLPCTQAHLDGVVRLTFDLTATG